MAAQAALGQAYEKGNGVPRNDDQAFKWYHMAAEQGDAEAENNVGVMCRMGEGVGRNKEEAVAWFRKAAHQKNSKAMFNLGAAYYNGDGVLVDDVASAAWFLIAQASGNNAANNAVQRATTEPAVKSGAAFVRAAQMYENGDDMPKDPVAALRWYRNAADAGDTEASVTVTSRLPAPGRNATPEDYAEARQRCEDAAEHGFSPGAYCVALIYRRGIGVTKDPAEVAKWLTRAAELGHAQAGLELGEAYWKGEGVKPDLAAAYLWIWLAYNAKVPGAEQDEQALRGEMPAKQVEQSKKKALAWARSHHTLGLRQRREDSSSPEK
jgi:TPR repeat protein